MELLPALLRMLVRLAAEAKLLAVKAATSIAGLHALFWLSTLCLPLLK